MTQYAAACVFNKPKGHVSHHCSGLCIALPVDAHIKFIALTLALVSSNTSYLSNLIQVCTLFHPLWFACELHPVVRTEKKSLTFSSAVLRCWKTYTLLHAQHTHPQYYIFKKVLKEEESLRLVSRVGCGAFLCGICRFS